MTEREDDDDAALRKMCGKAAARLGDAFDSVFIVATRSSPSGTVRYHGTFGNQFASCMVLRIAADELEEAIRGGDTSDDSEDEDAPETDGNTIGA